MSHQGQGMPLPRFDSTPAFFVTGATGFLARHLVPRLLAHGPVTALVRSTDHLPTWLDRCEVVQGDVTRPTSLPRLAPGTTVVHLAAIADVGRCQRFPRLAARVHVEGTLSLLQLARRAEARFVLASTAQVYGRLAGRITEASPLLPSTMYGATKAAAEHLCRATSGVEARIVRPFNMYGPGQGAYAVIPAIVRQLLDPDAEAVQLNALAPLRDFVWVEDAADLFVRVATAGQAPPVVNLASGTATSIGAVARLAAGVSGRELPVEGPPGMADPDFTAHTDAAASLGWQPATELRAGLAHLLAAGPARDQPA